MKGNKDVLALARQIIAIPSYVDRQIDERDLVAFLENFLSKRLPSLSITRQQFTDSGRANLLIRGKGEPRLLVVGHIDTVQPNDGWSTNPLQPVLKKGRLYGLGASDMKGSTAAFLAAMCTTGLDLDGMMLLLYGDEEYDFKGMKRFLSEAELPKPELTLSLDGSLALASGCRGLIELRLLIKGSAGHSSNPNNGANAITGTILAVQQLESELAKAVDKVLGPTTVNVGYLQGGIRQVDGAQESWRRAGNVIADTADITLEIRPALPCVTADWVSTRLAALLAERGLSIANVNVAHNITSWPADFDEPVLRQLEACYRTSGVAYAISDRTYSGYLDMQMLTSVIKAPAYVIGAGGSNKHGANENVPITNLRQATALYEAILKGFLGNE
jgi:acetylornithine deacetylase/succinyl-diaminopimelate desuccinylase-like protein